MSKAVPWSSQEFLSINHISQASQQPLNRIPSGKQPRTMSQETTDVWRRATSNGSYTIQRLASCLLWLGTIFSRGSSKDTLVFSAETKKRFAPHETSVSLDPGALRSGRGRRPSGAHAQAGLMRVKIMPETHLKVLQRGPDRPTYFSLPVEKTRVESNDRSSKNILMLLFVSWETNRNCVLRAAPPIQ